MGQLRRITGNDHRPAPGPKDLSSASSPQYSSASMPSPSSSDSSSTAYNGICPACIVDSPSGLLSQSCTTSSLGSLPSLTLSPDCHSISTHPDLNIKCEYHCVAVILLDTAVSSLVSAGDCLYGGSSSTNSVYVWSKQELNKGSSNVCKGTGAAKQFCSGRSNGAVRVLAAVGLDKVVTAHDDDKKIRVWSRRSPSAEEAPTYCSAMSLAQSTGAAHHEGLDNDSFKLLTTMPTMKDYLRTFLLARNYEQVRRHHKRLWIEHVDAISALCVSDKGKLLYSASWDRSIKVWRLPDFKCVESVRKAHADAINCMVVSRDGRFLYTGSADAKIKVWALRSADNTHEAAGGLKSCSSSTRLAHSMVRTLEGHKSAVNTLALSPDARVLYSGAGDKAIIVWELREESSQAAHMVRAGVLRGHRQAVLCLSTTAGIDNSHEVENTVDDRPQRHLLCSGSADKTIRVWKRCAICCGHDHGMQQEVQPHEAQQLSKTKVVQVQYKYYCVGVVEGHSGPVKCLSVSNNMLVDSHHQLIIYSASLDKTVKVWRFTLLAASYNNPIKQVLPGT